MLLHPSRVSEQLCFCLTRAARSPPVPAVPTHLFVATLLSPRGQAVLLFYHITLSLTVPDRRQRAASTTAPIDAHSMRAVLMLTLPTSGLPLQGQLGYFGGLVSMPVTVEDC